MGKEEEALALDVLRRGELFRYYGHDPQTPPRMVADLEAELSRYHQMPYALAVSSGTAALETVMGAIGIGPGSEVIIPAWSWISCFTSVVRCGALPVLAEIDESLNIDPAELERLATPHTRAVMVVHYQGVAAEMIEIVKLAHRRGWFVIEDCAEAPGATYRGRPVGTWGDAAILSFQHNKPVTAGEGGAILTRDQRVYERSVRISDLGQYRPHHQILHAATTDAFSGGQFRMSELTAAVALAQWRKLPKVVEHCRRLAQRIIQRLNALPKLTMRLEVDPAGTFPFEIYFFVESEALAGEFRRRLDARNVNCAQRTGTYPQYHRDYVKSGAAAHPAFGPARNFTEWPASGYKAEDFPRTEDLTRRFVALPLGWRYTLDDADYIAGSVEAIYEELLK